MLVDPMGVVRIDLGPAQGIGVGDVDLSYTEHVRALLPSLAGRRDDIMSGRVSAVPG
jgi:hypothetical protein